MFKEYYDQIEKNQDVRKNLIEIKALIKDPAKKEVFIMETDGDFHVFGELLSNEDAKSRKNAALILGELGDQKMLPLLFEAYERETQLFVKSSYLTAMFQLDYRPYIEEFKKHLEMLEAAETDLQNQKHISEEIKKLREMIWLIERPEGHTYAGDGVATKVLLTVAKGQEDVLLDLLEETQKKKVPGGCLVITEELSKLMDIRVFKDMYLMFQKKKCVSKDPEMIGKTIVSEGILDYLDKRHMGDGSYAFRVDVRGRMPLSKKSVLAKKTAMVIERESHHALVNSTSNYEIEFVLMEGKDESVNILLKLHTLKDHRFDYRRDVVAASIHPVNAALMMELAKEYLTEYAQVLDPFCGVGTLLIERQKMSKVRNLYGIDIFGDAINGGRMNAKAAGVHINYIHRDFFDFKHTYLFDEIVTDMPRQTGKVDADAIARLYQQFFEKLPEVLKDEAVLVIFGNENQLLKNMVSRYKYVALEKNILLSKKEKTYVSILRYHSIK